MNSHTTGSATADEDAIRAIHHGMIDAWNSMNARRLTIERQLFLDDMDSLRAEAQRQVSDLVATLKTK